jgi:predicted DNA-binding transcriptional regulator YafY
VLPARLLCYDTAMSKSNRLFDLMQMLRRHRCPVPGTELAREAGVSLRTIYRDIAALQALGAEIEGEPGVGYVMRPGFFLPPLMFSEEELQAVALGAQWVRRQTDDGLAFAAHNALSKIGAVLPSELRHKLNDNAFHVSRRSLRASSIDLRILRRAMREQRKLLIAYRDPKGAKTERIIWPIALGFFDSRRIIAGWCELRKDFRAFRADRIERAEIRVDRYPGRRYDLVKQWRAQVAHENGPSPDA